MRYLMSTSLGYNKLTYSKDKEKDHKDGKDKPHYWFRWTIKAKAQHVRSDMESKSEDENLEGECSADEDTLWTPCGETTIIAVPSVR